MQCSCHHHPAREVPPEVGMTLETNSSSVQMEGAWGTRWAGGGHVDGVSNEELALSGGSRQASVSLCRDRHGAWSSAKEHPKSPSTHGRARTQIQCWGPQGGCTHP